MAAQSAPMSAAITGEIMVPGWGEFLDGLRDLPDQILARLPEEQRKDPQIRQEAGRLALSALTASAIEALAGDPDYPVFVPQLGNFLTAGQPNADTAYLSATIRPGGTYRLRGLRGSLNHFFIVQSAPPPPPNPDGSVDLGPPRPVHDAGALHIDDKGYFDVILSQQKPDGYTGDWWPLNPATNKLLVRMVASDRFHEVQPSLSIERLDVPANRPRVPADVLRKRLDSIAPFAHFSGPLLAAQPSRLRAEGFINRFKLTDLSRQGGLGGQFYYESLFELGDDEALIIETPLPKQCQYRSIILTSDLYETIDWFNNMSSLNNSESLPDKDGILRVVVSERDPGVLNWLSTSGYKSGVIQGRWMNCSEALTPSVRKIAFDKVRSALPKDTRTVSADERDRMLRDRRAKLQQRATL